MSRASEYRTTCGRSQTHTCVSGRATGLQGYRAAGRTRHSTVTQCFPTHKYFCKCSIFFIEHSAAFEVSMVNSRCFSRATPKLGETINICTERSRKMEAIVHREADGERLLTSVYTRLHIKLYITRIRWPLIVREQHTKRAQVILVLHNLIFSRVYCTCGARGAGCGSRLLYI